MKSKYFLLQELIPESTYNTQKDKAWDLLSPELIELIDGIKELFPDYKLVINTWHDKELVITKGIFRFRGYRYSGLVIGNLRGGHYKGKAIDFDAYDKKGRKIDSGIIRKIILLNKGKLKHLRGLEVAEWVHVDCLLRNGQKEGTICVFDQNNNVEWK